MTKRIYIAAILGMLAIYGCSDDSKKDTSATPGACTDDSECDSGKCISGICQAETPVQNDCQKDSDCSGDQVCHEGKCENNTQPEPECTEDSDCSGDQVCHAGKCENNTQLESECTEDSECDGNQSCVSGHCVPGEMPGPGDGTCQSDEDCADQGVNLTCMSDGLCGHYVNLGDTCGLDAYCEDGYECMGVCYEVLSQDAECNPDDSLHVCDLDNGMMCVEGYCRLMEYNIQSGNECNSYKLCSDDLTCLEGKCQSVKKEDESCDESNYQVCDTGLICKNAKCTPLGKKCSQTTDCTEKDSFCCLEDSCGAKEHCIPYDENITHDESCRYKTKPGIFEAQVQCRWQPPADAYPNSARVEMPPLVGHFGNKAGLDTVVAFFSYNARNSWSDTYPKASFEGTIRFIHPETCETLESVGYNQVMYQGNNQPAAADLDGDGLMEFITITNQWKLAAYTWDKEKKAHKVMWETEEITSNNNYVNVYDVDGDGKPEVVWGTTVVNGQDGSFIYKGGKVGGNGAIGNFDRNSEGVATLVISDSVLKWNKSSHVWDTIAKIPAHTYKAYADFGTPGADPASFDFKTLDGYPEIVSSSGGNVYVYALIPKGDGTFDTQDVMHVTLMPSVMTGKGALGGPLTVGDFDKDGLPEIGVASSGFFGVYDPLCAGYKADECADKYVLWERWSQDESSGVTGSSLFDFDGDGQTEAVYADECFTRVYDGKTGKVLFSAKRSSSTSFEAPVVADIDGDGSTEILMGSDTNAACFDDNKVSANPSNPGTSNCVDPIHEGIRCKDDEDCPAQKNCNKTIGFCICTEDSECNTQYKQGTTEILTQYVCAEPIHPQVGMMVNSDNTVRKLVKDLGTRPDGYSGDYKVCRATRKTVDLGIADLMIFRDRLDRWVSSRDIWNQHSYNILNIEDNGKTPTPAQWLMNWLAKNSDGRPVYNNYRMNRQGKYGAGTVPDITGRFIAGSICGTKKDSEGKPVVDEKGKPIHIISGNLCNRGTKPVALKLPATFFYYDESKEDHRGDPICTSYTKTIVGVGECGQVGCEVSEDELKNMAGKTVIMVTNLDEFGNASTVECNNNNNTDVIKVDECNSDIVIIN